MMNTYRPLPYYRQSDRTKEPYIPYEGPYDEQWQVARVKTPFIIAFGLVVLMLITCVCVDLIGVTVSCIDHKQYEDQAGWFVEMSWADHWRWYFDDTTDAERMDDVLVKRWINRNGLVDKWDN